MLDRTNKKNVRYVLSIKGAHFQFQSSKAGAEIEKIVFSNLRKILLYTGYDYVGFSIKYAHPEVFDEQNIENIIRSAIRDDESGQLSADNIRLVISDAPVQSSASESDYKLLITTRDGVGHEWAGADGGVTAEVQYAATDSKEDATAVDIFQDIGLAQCSSIQVVIDKYLDADHALLDFFAKKVEFVRGLEHPGLPALAEDCIYFPFSAAVRSTDSLLVLDKERAERVGALWDAFFCRYFSDHFLSWQEAVDFVENQKFRAYRASKHKSRASQSIKKKYLEEVLRNGSVVDRDGCYVLCKLIGSDKVGKNPKYGGFFKKKGKTTYYPLRLVKVEQYQKEAVPFVESGDVVPIRLFLKKI